MRADVTDIHTGKIIEWSSESKIHSYGYVDLKIEDRNVMITHEPNQEPPTVGQKVSFKVQNGKPYGTLIEIISSSKIESSSSWDSETETPNSKSSISRSASEEYAHPLCIRRRNEKAKQENRSPSFHRSRSRERDPTWEYERALFWEIRMIGRDLEKTGSRVEHWKMRAEKLRTGKDIDCEISYTRSPERIQKRKFREILRQGGVVHRKRRKRRMMQSPSPPWQLQKKEKSTSEDETSTMSSESDSSSW